MTPRSHVPTRSHPFPERRIPTRSHVPPFRGTGEGNGNNRNNEKQASRERERLLKVCPGCGEVSETTWCAGCKPKMPSSPKTSSTKRGYDTAWRKLSERARRLQPWCSDCGTRDDLTVDHLPIAWQRKAEGKSVRLSDVEVVCRSCNSKRGAARGVGAREAASTLAGQAKFRSRIAGGAR